MSQDEMGVPSGPGSRPTDEALRSSPKASIPNAFQHHRTCNAAYPEKEETGEAAQHMTEVDLGGGEFARVCVDCGAHRVVSSEIVAIVNDYLQARLPMEVSNYQIRCVSLEIASAIEAQRATTNRGLVEDESAVPAGQTPTTNRSKP